MSLVLDSSAALAWIYADEVTDSIRRVFETVNESGAWVTALWRLEVGNILEMGIRKGRHDIAFRDSTFADLALLPIHLDLETDGHAWGATACLAERHRLTTYDAAYLELAQRRGLPLATLDRDLEVAAESEGVVVLGRGK